MNKTLSLIEEEEIDEDFVTNEDNFEEKDYSK